MNTNLLRLERYMWASVRMGDRAHCAYRYGDIDRALLRYRAATRLQRWAQDENAVDHPPRPTRTKAELLGHQSPTLEIAHA